jgi:hypothetical protein
MSNPAVTSPAVTSPAVTGAGFCDHCGHRADDRDHEACGAARVFEPPRYCAQCGRRTIVKVTPDGWSGRCARHGVVTSAA